MRRREARFSWSWRISTGSTRPLTNCWEWWSTRTTHLPVLTLITTRPEHPDHWRHRPNVSEMRLLTLDRDDSLTMIHWLCRGHAVPGSAMTAIAERADGLPLFIEDLTKDIVEMSELQQLRSVEAARGATSKSRIR